MSSVNEMQHPTGLFDRTEPPRYLSMLPRWGILLVALLAQVVAALTIREMAVLGFAHAAGLMLLGLYAALRRDLALVLCVLAYLTGSEVMWRQTSAPIPYLAAPYLMILLSTFAVIIGLGRLGKDARLALLYIALMLPAAINTIRTAGNGSRELIAFALSGPIALAAFVAFASQVKVAPWLYRRVLWVTLISAVGPLTVAISYLRADLAASATGTIEFRGQSNFVASGGFGPVQVSSALSLGILAAVLLLLSEPSRTARILVAVTGSIMMVQTLLTFSRGGSFSIAIAVIALAISHTSNVRVRRRIVTIGALALVLAYFLVFPWLETFTQGAFEQRFSDTTSSRTDLAANDTEIFRQNLVLGAGPGMTKFQRLGYEVCELRSDRCKDEASSHTEFTRMLGEHGIPGVASLVVLAVLAWNAYRRKGAGREFAVALLAWSIAQMFYANLRITAVPFAFGLAFLRVVDDRSDDDDHLDDDLDDDRAVGSRPRPDPHDPRAGRPVGFGAGYGTRFGPTSDEGRTGTWQGRTP